MYIYMYVCIYIYILMRILISEISLLQYSLSTDANEKSYVLKRLHC